MGASNMKGFGADNFSCLDTSLEFRRFSLIDDFQPDFLNQTNSYMTPLVTN